MGASSPRVRRRLTHTATAALLVTALLLPGLRGGAAADDRIDPGRPELVSSTGTVAPGRIQVESGVAYERTGRRQRRLAIETALRTGITDDIEARINAEPLVLLRGAEHASGVGDVTLGVKYRILRARDGGPAFGILPSVTLPVAEAPIGSERPDFGLIGLAAFDLPWGLDLDVNAGVDVVGQRRPTGFIVAGVVGTALSRDVGPKVTAFAETLLTSRTERDGRDQLQAGAGVVWRLTRAVAVDLAAYAGLGEAPDYEIRGGVSVRLPR